MEEEEDDKAKIVKTIYKIQAQANDDEDEAYLVDPIRCNRKWTCNLSRNDEDADVALIAEKGPVALRDFPHPRHLCANFPFNTTSPESCCAQCFCYVCDIAAPCLEWAGTSRHCDATEKPS